MAEEQEEEYKNKCELAVKKCVEKCKLLLWCEVEEHSFPGLSNTSVHCAHYNSSYINRKEYYALTGKGTLVSRVNKKSSVQCRVEKGKLSPAMCFEGVGFHRALLQYFTMGPRAFYSLSNVPTK